MEVPGFLCTCLQYFLIEKENIWRNMFSFFYTVTSALFTITRKLYSYRHTNVWNILSIIFNVSSSGTACINSNKKPTLLVPHPKMMQMLQRGKVWKQFYSIQLLQTILCHENRHFSQSDPVSHPILWQSTSYANGNGQDAVSWSQKCVFIHWLFLNLKHTLGHLFFHYGALCLQWMRQLKLYMEAVSLLARKCNVSQQLYGAMFRD